MGIISAAAKSLSSGLADQWLEVIEPSDMGAQTFDDTGHYGESKNHRTAKEADM